MAKDYQYYMPQGVYDFLGWGRNFVEMARPNSTNWGLVKLDLDKMEVSLTALDSMVKEAESSRATKEIIRQKNAMLKQVRESFRVFVNAYINWNPKVNDYDRANLRVHVRDTIRTPIPRPVIHVSFAVKPLVDHNLRIDFVEEESGKKRIPYGMSGVVLHSSILADGAPPPLRGEDLASDKLMTSTPHVEEYGPDVSGKRVAYSCAWQNEKGEKGEFSDVQVHVIP